MLRKAGVVFEKNLSDQFDPSDPDHLRALACRKKTGAWPPGFPAEGVWEDPGWEAVVDEAVGGKMPEKIDRWALEYGWLLRLVSFLHFPGYEFKVSPLGEDFVLQVSYVEPDVMTGVPETQEGRRWLFPSGQTAGQVVQTAFKAVLTSLEHRAREHFLYMGKPVLQPHLDIEALWASLPKADRHGTEIFNNVA